MINHAEVAEAIEQFIRRTFSVAADDPDFSQTVHIFDYGYVDSFGAVALTEFVETEFSLKISNGDLMLHSMNTVGEIADFVVGRTEGRI